MTPEEVYALTPLMVGRLVRRGAAPDVAEDVVAKVVEAAVRRGGMPDQGYVWVSVRRGLIDFYRSSRNAGPITEAMHLSGDEQFEDRVVGRLAARKRLELCRIHPRYAESLALHHAHGLPFSEVGEQMGCTAKEAERLATMGTAKLRFLMGVTAVDGTATRQRRDQKRAAQAKYRELHRQKIRDRDRAAYAAKGAA